MGTITKVSPQGDSMRQKRSFIFLFAFMFLFCNMLLLSMASYTYYHSTVDVMLESVYQYTYTIMNQTRFGFNQYMSYHKDALNAIAANDNIISAYQCYELNNIPSLTLYEKRLAESIKDTLKYHPEILDIIIITDNGFVTNKDTRNSIAIPQQLIDTQWYSSAISYSRNDSINFFKTNLSFYKPYVAYYNASVIGISRPLYDYLQNKIGIVTCFMDTDMLTQSAFNHDCTQYGDLFFLDSNNNYLMGTDKDESALPQSPYFTIEDSMILSDIFKSKPSVLKMHSEYFDCSILYRINTNITNEANTIRYMILLILGISFLLNLLLTQYLFKKFSKPVKQLVSDIQTIKATNYLQLKGDYRYGELTIIASNFNDLMHNLHLLNDAKIETELSLQKAQNSMLLSKLNPHFLFNALQLIQTESMYGSKENTNRIILSLSNQLRYNIYEAADQVPISRELERTIEYLQLTKFIYEDRFDYILNVDHTIYPSLIPKFTLHILVENSIKHGFENTPSHNHIEIDGIKTETQIILTVKDDGKGISEEKINCIRSSLREGTYEGIGLRSLTQQLEFIYGDKYSLEILSDSNGTSVILSIPYTPDIHYENEKG